MVALNPLFTRKFLSVCKRFQQGDEFDDGPRLWRRALDYYMRCQDQLVHALVLMAEAHILEDLADALYELEAQTGVRIDQQEFQAALDVIIACLEDLNRSVKDTESIVDFLWFKLVPHFGVIEKVQNLKVAQLRQAAWEEYQLRRHFASMQRTRKHKGS